MINKILILLSLIVFVSIAKAETEPYYFSRVDISQGLSNNQVHCIFRDSRGFIWFGTNSGLNRYDGYTFKIFKNVPNDSTSLSDNRVNGLFEDKYGKIWVVLSESFNVYDPITEKFSQESEIDSLAILPFVNMSGNEEADYLCNGIPESVINDLQKIPNLRMASFSSLLYRYKDKINDPVVVGEELNVRG